MIHFPEAFLQTIIVGALILTGLAAAALLILVIVDYIRRQVW